MAEQTDIQKDLQLLAADLKRLEGEYNMFFSGRLPRPPWETRGRVAARMACRSSFNRASVGSWAILLG